MTEHYTALLILSLCWLAIAWNACVLAIGIKRELLEAIRFWRVQKALHRDLRVEPRWPRWLRTERWGR